MHLYNKTGSFDGDTDFVFETFEENVLEWMGNMVKNLNFKMMVKYLNSLKR